MVKFRLIDRAPEANAHLTSCWAAKDAAGSASRRYGIGESAAAFPARYLPVVIPR